MKNLQVGMVPVALDCRSGPAKKIVVAGSGPDSRLLLEDDGKRKEIEFVFGVRLHEALRVKLFDVPADVVGSDGVAANSCWKTVRSEAKTFEGNVLGQTKQGQEAAHKGVNVQ